MSVNAFPGLFGANWEKLSMYLKEAGKDPATYPTIAYHNININPDRTAALEETNRFLDEYYGPVFAPPDGGVVDRCRRSRAMRGRPPCGGA
jgi:hypothetical protein